MMDHDYVKITVCHTDDTVQLCQITVDSMYIVQEHYYTPDTY